MIDGIQYYDNNMICHLIRTGLFFIYAAILIISMSLKNHNKTLKVLMAIVGALQMVLYVLTMIGNLRVYLIYFYGETIRFGDSI